MDADMWWSATPEDVALQIAARCSCPLLWDGFGGVSQVGQWRSLPFFPPTRGLFCAPYHFLRDLELYNLGA